MNHCRVKTTLKFLDLNGIEKMSTERLLEIVNEHKDELSIQQLKALKMIVPSNKAKNALSRVLASRNSDDRHFLQEREDDHK